MAVRRPSLRPCWCRSSSLTGTWTRHCSPSGPSQGASPLTPVGVVLKPLRLLSVQRPDLGAKDHHVGKPVTHFPFLIVFLPSRGSRTGSMVSPMFSMSKVSPSEMACSMVSR